MRYENYSVSYSQTTGTRCQGIVTSLDSDVSFNPCGHLASHMVRDEHEEEFYSCIQCGLTYLDEDPLATMRSLQEHPIITGDGTSDGIYDGPEVPE